MRTREPHRPPIRTLLSAAALVAALVVPGTATAADLSVDCDVGERLQAAIDAAAAQPGPDSVTVSGTCTESVLISDPAPISLSGEPGARLVGDGTTSVVRVVYGWVEIAGLEITAGGGTRGGGVYVGGSVFDLTITDSTITDNHVSDYGGGFYLAKTTQVSEGPNLIRLERVAVTDNTASSGGGLAFGGGQRHVTLVDSVVSDNQASSSAGGIFTGIHNSPFQGRPGELLIDSTTITRNRSAGSGGGIYHNESAMTLRNSTVSGNSTTYGPGGGIYTYYARETVIETSTITYNTTGSSDGGGIHSHRSSYRSPADVITSSILAANTSPGQARYRDMYSHAAYRVLSGGYNVIGIDNLVGFVSRATDIRGVAGRQVNPLLFPLADNGGPRIGASGSDHLPTHLPKPASPALDTWATSACALDVDQRDVTRPQGSACDRGAVEVEVATNLPPVAVEDGYSTDEDTTLTVDAPGVLGNDSDPDSDPLTANLQDDVGHGTLTLGTDGSFTYVPDADWNGTDTFIYTAFDGELASGPATVEITVRAADDSTVVAVEPAVLEVQYSDHAVFDWEVGDIDSYFWVDQPQQPQPAALRLRWSAPTTTEHPNWMQYSWGTITGTAMEPAGSYPVVVEADPGDHRATSTLRVVPEDATVRFSGDNPVAERVDDAGDSPPVVLTMIVSESDPDVAALTAGPGDIGLAEVTVQLSPVGPGGTVAPSGCTRLVDGVGYDGTLTVTCLFDDVPVNTYIVDVDVDGGYFAGSGEDVFTVYDPAAGFASGGGWFFWPDTAELDVGYPGDKTNLGFTMKYNKKGNKVRGSLLMVRHLPDGSIYRVKSNALDGLAVGEVTGADPYGWASFTGKATYREPGWPDPVGNHEFLASVTDRGEPGTGTDTFQLWIWDQDDQPVTASWMTSPETLGGGNLVVPHTPRR